MNCTENKCMEVKREVVTIVVQKRKNEQLHLMNILLKMQPDDVTPIVNIGISWHS